MEHRRGRLEITRDILEVAKSGVGITAIVYGANLNWPIARKHIQDMELADLITVRELPGSGNRLYTTTERGLDFIKSLDETVAILMAPLVLDMIAVQEVSEG